MGAEPRMTLQTLRVIKVLFDDPSAHHYGLEIAKSTELPTGTIYPILARLEQAGWVTSDWETIDPTREGRPRRRFYQLNAIGSRRAARALYHAQQSIAPRWRATPGFSGGSDGAPA
jgi:DNA-binding PadR family transcriptional regulator